MPKTIIIPQGSTLGGLASQYKTTVGELMKINPNIKDPNVISAGANLNIPELGGTLETGTPGLPGSPEEKTLPEGSPDRLAVFGNVLKTVTERAAQESNVRGAEALPEGILSPEKMSGGSFANVLSTITENKTRGVADIYKSTIDMLDATKKRAEDQLSTLISTGAIVDLDDNQLEKLSAITDFDIEYLKSIKKSQVEEDNEPSNLTDSDRISKLNNFMVDKIGGDSKVSARSYMDAYKEWIGLGGSINDFKYAYPVEEWVGQHEYGNLPSNWRPEAGKIVQDVETLPVEKQTLIKQIQVAINEGIDLDFDQAIKEFPELAAYLNPGKD